MRGGGVKRSNNIGHGCLSSLNWGSIIASIRKSLHHISDLSSCPGSEEPFGPT